MTRKKVLTQSCGGCDFCKIDDSNRVHCTWGKSKAIKVLGTPKRKGGYPECNLKRD